MKSILISLIFLSTSLGVFAQSLNQEIYFRTDPAQKIDVRFRLFETKNISTFLLLDTATGRIWEVHYSVQSDSPAGVVVLNAVSLASQGAEAKSGTFTLYPTRNIFNFILINQDDGHAWQCQWSFEKKNRGLIPLPVLEQKENNNPPAK
jgi:hypothetical protein